jgi:hypothetical protein
MVSSGDPARERRESARAWVSATQSKKLRTVARTPSSADALRGFQHLALVRGDAFKQSAGRTLLLKW